MAGLLNAAGIDNGFTSWWDANRRALTGFGVGLANGPTFSQGIGLGTQGLAQGAQADDAYATQQKAEAERLAQINQTVEWARTQFPEELANVPDHMAGQLAADLWQKQYMGGAADTPASVQEYQFYANQTLASGGTPKPYEEWRQGSNQTVRAGLGQPVILRKKGSLETSPFMPMSDGTYINPLTQEVANEEWEFDPSYIAAQRAQGTKIGGEVGAAQFDLPAAKLSMEQSLGAIADIRAQSDGMGQQFGKLGGVIPEQMIPAIPGTEKAKFQVAVDRGVNRAFLEAREILRGGGQITDFESRKAESAITNMQSAMEKGDQGQFLEALDDFEQAIKAGYAKLQAQAGTLPAVGGGAAPAGDLKSKYGLE
jgi:hypothetical protein